MEQEKYKAEFGEIVLEGDLDFIIETMYTVYGKSLRQISIFVNLSPQGVLDRITKLQLKKRNQVLEDKSLLKSLSDIELMNIYDFNKFSIAKARKKLNLTVRDCCKHHLSITNRRKRLINKIFGSKKYTEGKLFSERLGQIIDSLELKEDDTKILVDFYITAKSFNKSKRGRKYQLVQKIKKQINKYPVEYWIQSNLIKKGKSK